MEIYNTTWWGNAIDTAITAGTEPDFFGSQMKMLTSQQPEIIVNGDFDGNANNWTLDSGVAYGDNNLVFATDSNQKATQTQTFTVGKTYRVSIELVAYTSGIITVRMGSVPQVITTDIGVKTWDIIAIGNLARIEGTFGVGVSATIDNVSVKLVRAEEVEAVKCLADWIHTTALQDLNN